MKLTCLLKIYFRRVKDISSVSGMLQAKMWNEDYLSKTQVCMLQYYQVFPYLFHEYLAGPSVLSPSGSLYK